MEATSGSFEGADLNRAQKFLSLFVQEILQLFEALRLCLPSRISSPETAHAPRPPSA